MKNEIITILVTCLMLCLYVFHTNAVDSAVSNAVVQLQQESEHQNKLLEQQVQEQTSSLQLIFETVVQEKNNEIQNLNTRIALLTNSVQSRPSRDSEASNLSEATCNAESTGYVTADRLYREDAEFLVWYSSQAEQLRLELLACYMQYDKAKGLLDSLDSPRTD